MKNGEKNGEPASTGKMGSVTLHCIFMDMVGFSDVLCRYSLGTNPRGVKEYVFIHYTLVTILVGLSVDYLHIVLVAL